jgi:sulfide dehydrogenase cytochrome subunit
MLNRSTAIVLLLPVFVLPVVAGEYVPDAGRLLASNCFQCHGVDGNVTGGGFESLAGEDDIMGEMLEMSLKFGNTSTDREEEIMQAHAFSYKASGSGANTAELSLISQYFAGTASSGGGEGEGEESGD